MVLFLYKNDKMRHILIELGLIVYNLEKNYHSLNKMYSVLVDIWSFNHENDEKTEK
jgi:hypothetical protein